MAHFGAQLGALIAKKREDRGWSFAQLAVAAYGDDGNGGETRKADVQKLEAGGSKKPHAATIRKYRLALDLSQDEIDACRTAAEIELAAFAQQLFAVIVEGAKAAGLSEDLALSVSEHYAQNNHGNFEGAIASLKSALDVAAQQQDRGRLPTNYVAAVNDIVARVTALNNEGEIDQAYAELKQEAARRKDARDMQVAEDGRVLESLIAQATLANDADGYAQAHLERVQLDSPSAEDCFRALRSMFIERYEQGLRFGTPFALTAAMGLARKCAEIAPTPYLCAMAQNDLAVALRNQGIRTSGEKGAALLAQAVDSYRAALRVRTEADHPVDWASSMQNLAIALQQRGIRTSGAEGDALLAQAVDSYRAALRVRTEADYPVDWAMSMQNLAVALQRQGIRTAGAEGGALLGQAVDSYRAALGVYTEADHRVDWAMSMQNLGTALQDQGIRTAGAEGAAHMAQAVDCYRAALRVYTEADFPVQWAMSMQNLGAALQDQGIRTAGAEGAALLGQGVDSFRAALRVRTEADHPVQWAMTQKNMAIAERAWAWHDSTDDPRPHLQAALVHVDNALRVYDPDHMAYYHEMAMELRNDILKDLSS